MIFSKHCIYFAGLLFHEGKLSLYSQNRDGARYYTFWCHCFSQSVLLDCAMGNRWSGNLKKESMVAIDQIRIWHSSEKCMEDLVILHWWRYLDFRDSPDLSTNRMILILYRYGIRLAKDSGQQERISAAEEAGNTERATVRKVRMKTLGLFSCGQPSNFLSSRLDDSNVSLTKDKL